MRARMGRRPVLSSRSGLTLIECLFAAAILAVGVIGIMSLVPFSIRQVGASMGSTICASISKNAFVSLGRRQFDLADYPAVEYAGNTTDRLFATRFRDAWANVDSSRLNVGAAGTPLAVYPDMPSAIYAYHVGTATVGDGGAAPTFKVPGLPTEQYFTAGTWSGLGIPVPVGSNNPSLIPVPWATDYGWTATFLPISADDDGDGLFDEDPVDGVDQGLPDADDFVDEDDLIMPGTSYRVQVAVWRAYRLRCGPGAVAVNGTFYPGQPGTVALSAAVPDALPGDYIRLDRYGIWFKIAAIDGTDVTLIGQFRHPAGTLGGGPVSIASPVNLMELYEGVIAPRSLRGSP